MLSKTFSLRRKLTSLVYNCNAEFFKLKMTRHNNTILKLKNTCYQKSVAVRRKLKSFECNSVLKFSPIVNERCHPIKSSIFASECNSFRKKRRRSYKFSYLFSNRRRTATLGVTRIGRDWRFAFFEINHDLKKIIDDPHFVTKSFAENDDRLRSHMIVHVDDRIRSIYMIYFPKTWKAAKI